MQNDSINTYDLYNDIKNRTGGEIYIGVLGPVRTGKIHVYQTVYGADGAPGDGRRAQQDPGQR